MYRLITESLLGLRLEVDKLRFAPCLPADWTSFKIHYRYRETFYHITIHNSGAGATVCRLSLDGAELSDDFVTLIDDRQEHKVEVELHRAKFRRDKFKVVCEGQIQGVRASAQVCRHISVDGEASRSSLRVPGGVAVVGAGRQLLT